MEIPEFLHEYVRKDLLFQLRIYPIVQVKTGLLLQCRLFLCFDCIGFEVGVMELGIGRVFREGISSDDLAYGDVLPLLQLL